MPAVELSKIGNYIVFSKDYGPWAKSIAATDMAISTLAVSDVGLAALAAAGPVGWIAIGCYAGTLL